MDTYKITYRLGKNDYGSATGSFSSIRAALAYAEFKADYNNCTIVKIELVES